MDNNTLKKRPSIIDVLSKEPEKKEGTAVVSPSDRVNEPQKEIIKERVIVKYQDRPRGCAPDIGCGCGCRTITCGGCLLFILVIIGFAYIIINKPAFIWSEVVEYLNDGQKAPKYEPQDLTTLQESINSQISNIGEVSINLTQDQLTTLIRNNTVQLKDLTVDIDPNLLTLYWYLDNSLPAKPLYGIVEIKSTESGNLEITKVGTGKVGLPDAVNKFATNTVYSLLNLENTEGTSPLSILTSIFNSENITVKSVKLEDGLVKITADIKVNLFDQ